MDLEEFSKKMTSNLKELKIMADEFKINQVYNFMNLLLEWNEKINLTAITEPDEIILKHFIDSLTILKYIDEKDKVIDIGTGAGFPGIPIKIFRDNINMTLLDSLNKRINFLNEVITKLKIKDIVTIHSRAEQLNKTERFKESYDVAVTRAVAKLDKLALYMLPFVKQNRNLYMYERKKFRRNKRSRKKYKFI